MNRQERRKLLRQLDIGDAFQFRLDYKVTIPPGLLRNQDVLKISGTIHADDEASLIRNVVSRLIELYYAAVPTEDQELVIKLFAGTICDVLGPASPTIRGLIAHGLVEGIGLDIKREILESNPDEPVVSIYTIEKYGSLRTEEKEQEKKEETREKTEEEKEEDSNASD